MYETVYLFNTSYKSYAFSTDQDGSHGSLKVELWDRSKVEFLIQSYDKESQNFIFKQLYGEKLDEDTFLKSVTDFVYIFNKNQLKYKAKIERTNFDNVLQPWAIIHVNPKVDILEMERILATTKIVNKKVKTDVPMDKMIYQTAKSEGKEYEWSVLTRHIKTFLEKYAKNQDTGLHAVLNGSKITPQWSKAQYRSGKKKEAEYDFFVILEKLRQFRNRYKD